MAEVTGLIDLHEWPAGSRLILGKERPHPGAQVRFTDVDGHRITSVLTTTAVGGAPRRDRRGGTAPPPARPVEDRIREAKATGLRNLPCRGFTDTAAWLEAVLTAVDLLCRTKTICFANIAELTRCEIHAFRCRVLHVAARLTRGARRLHLRIDKTWRWATHIAEGFTRLRAAFARPEGPQTGSTSRPTPMPAHPTNRDDHPRSRSPRKLRRRVKDRG